MNIETEIEHLTAIIRHIDALLNDERYDGVERVYRARGAIRDILKDVLLAQHLVYRDQ